ncbi:hypothetical protein VKT23_018412 [Stygiomarasmius scandens]|uniref:Uncharacterized protein n=1 Tax=Marasmiellus scandens TaxID=2682957 RepID=A0ABR1IP37_9AGAR
MPRLFTTFNAQVAAVTSTSSMNSSAHDAESEPIATTATITESMSSSTYDQNSSPRSNALKITGGTIGGVAFLSILFVLAFLLWRQSMKRRGFSGTVEPFQISSFVSRSTAVVDNENFSITDNEQEDAVTSRNTKIPVPLTSHTSKKMMASHQRRKAAGIEHIDVDIQNRDSTLPSIISPVPSGRQEEAKVIRHLDSGIRVLQTSSEHSNGRQGSHLAGEATIELPPEYSFA